MGKVFVSYRRQGEHVVGVAALAHMLGAYFGAERVFIDTGLESGDHYPARLRAELEASTVVLAMVYGRWVEDFTVDRDTDWVLLELSTALRAGKVVIPVLLDRVRQPEPGEVPGGIVDVVLKQSLRVHYDRFADDVAVLIALIAKSPAAPEVEGAVADPSGDLVKRPVLRLTSQAVAYAVAFGMIGLAAGLTSDLVGAAMLCGVALVLTVVTGVFACFSCVVDVASLVLRAQPRMVAVGPLRQRLTAYWMVPVTFVFLWVLGWWWTLETQYAEYSGFVKAVLSFVILVATIRLTQKPIRHGMALDRSWPPPISPDPTTFRRAATRLQELLTATPHPRRSFVQQKQATSVLDALVETRSTLTERSRLPLRRWVLTGCGGSLFPSVVLGTTLAVAVFATCSLVVGAAAGGAIRAGLLAVASLVVSVLFVAVTLVFDLRVQRKHAARLAAELDQWEGVLRPLLLPAGQNHQRSP
ncbi:toll/interleukin-1 receptor domain-containing protein [Actinokineospora cianjurensis]|uniref:TIR domain-containing protein n=1 Tax=Actinokineospora cianjurensis TaxID=585224 RepID=A0A421AWI4_9PSEU|nr:toll/interleukin-1 receptor domain-containing protein [Actinokineospora cianjurensis]RLK54196.1 TIR domain-containing protein [Actinokineospora cianjurensis]